jgi:hypothetical protein
MESEIKEREPTQSREVDLVLQINPQHDKVGNVEIICGGGRVRGPSNAVLIGTYFLIIIPTLIYAIIM